MLVADLEPGGEYFDDVVVDSALDEGAAVRVGGAPDVVDVAVPDWGDGGEAEVVSGLGVFL